MRFVSLLPPDHPAMAQLAGVMSVASLIMAAPFPGLFGPQNHVHTLITSGHHSTLSPDQRTYGRITCWAHGQIRDLKKLSA